MELAFRVLILPVIKERNFLVFHTEKSLKKAGIVNVNLNLDWGKEILIGLFGGAKPTGGFAISVIKIEVTDNSLVIGFKERKPKVGDIVSQAVTFPGQWITVKQQDLPGNLTEIKFINQNGVEEKVIPLGKLTL